MIHKICKSEEKHKILDIIFIGEAILQKASHELHSRNSETM